MKRYATLLLLLSIFISCKKEDHTPATNTNEYAEIPNWLNRALLADLSGGGIDTVYAYMQNDLSYIRYKGIPYRVRAQKGLTEFVVSDTGRKFYITVFDGRDNPIMDCFVRPGQYLHNDHFVSQTQVFAPINVAPFANPNRMGDYQSR